MRDPFSEATDVVRSSIQFGFQEVIGCLSEQQIQPKTDNNAHQRNGQRANQKIRDEQAIPHTPDELFRQRTDERHGQKYKENNEEKREEIAAQQRVSGRRHHRPIRHHYDEKNERDTLEPAQFGKPCHNA